MSIRVFLTTAIALGATVAQAQTVTKTNPIEPGVIQGRVVVGPGVPASSCTAVVVGTPLKGTCDTSGNFTIRKAPPGDWDVDITVPGVATRRVIATANTSTDVQGPVTYLGEVQVGQLGGVTGQITLMNTSDLDATVVSIPALGLFVQPNIGGYYLLSGVAPGSWSFVVYVNGRASTPKPITVGSGALLTGNDWTNKYTVNGTFTGGTTSGGAVIVH